MSTTASEVREAATQTITTLNVAQQVFPSNISRRGFVFANTSAVLMTIRFGALDATVPLGIPVAAGQTYSAIAELGIGARVSVICAAATSTFYAIEFI